MQLVCVASIKSRFLLFVYVRNYGAVRVQVHQGMILLLYLHLLQCVLRNCTFASRRPCATTLSFMVPQSTLGLFRKQRGVAAGTGFHASRFCFITGTATTVPAPALWSWSPSHRRPSIRVLIVAASRAVLNPKLHSTFFRRHVPFGLYRSFFLFSSSRRVHLYIPP